MYLIAALVLLVVMLFFVLRPWLFASEPLAAGAVDLTDPAAQARSAATVERVVRAPSSETTAAAAETAAGSLATAHELQEPAIETAAEADAAPAAAPEAASAPTGDVRASVEAAIAARKAALRARHCTTCEAVVEDGDAFCRSCGTKVTA
jgi:cytoskeletal protein RodZ